MNTIPRVHPLLRPRWLFGHALVVVTITAFVFLGMWQLRRHDEKVTLRDAVVTATESSAVPIEQVPDGAFARVSISGVFDGQTQMRAVRSRDGESGYEVLTTLILDGGSALLVDRGWVGIDAAVPAPPSRIDGEGILWPPQSGSIPDEFPEFVSRIDPAVVAAFSAYEVRSEYLILTVQDSPFDLKPPEVGEVSLGPHLGYAAQWFLFAGVVLVGYPILLKRSARKP